MTIGEIAAALISLGKEAPVEGFVTDIYNVDICDDRRMTLVLGTDELILVEFKMRDDDASDEVYRLTMSDGYQGVAKLAKYFDIDIADTNAILDDLYNCLADIVGEEGEVDRIKRLLSDLGINYTESY